MRLLRIRRQALPRELTGPPCRTREPSAPKGNSVQPPARPSAVTRARIAPPAAADAWVPTRRAMVHRSPTWAVETCALWIGAQHTNNDPRDVVEDGDAGQQIHPSRQVRVMQATY